MDQGSGHTYNNLTHVWSAAPLTEPEPDDLFLPLSYDSLKRPVLIR